MRYRVLLCEDDPMVLSINEKFLSCLDGFDVAGRVSDGATLLETFTRCGGVVDLILLDLFLPGMDGLEALRQLRFRGYEGDVIVLTSGDRSGSYAKVVTRPVAAVGTVPGGVSLPGAMIVSIRPRASRRVTVMWPEGEVWRVSESASR